MPKLVVNPRSPTPWEIKLKPGANFLGRGFTNDFKIDDPSVSGSHCQIMVDQTGILITDLGSTNGTFVDRAPVKEAPLRTGQTVHIGSVEMLLQSDSPGVVRLPDPPAATANPAPVQIAVPPPPSPAGGLRINAGHARAPQPIVQQAAPAPVEAPVAPPLTPEAGATAAAGSNFCKFHPRTPARYFCGKCNKFFCELCVTARGQKRTCRGCGAECTSVQVKLARPVQKKFFTLLPGAIIYPFKGSGLIVLISGTVVFAILELISMGWMSILAKAAALGYLFSYMQNIIHATAAEEVEMPGLPGLDDVFGGFFRLAVTVCICFGLPIIFAILRVFFEQEALGPLILPTLIVGTLYFPMAFLAVAMKDSAMAANPMVVFPAIFKAPVGYFVTAILVTAVLVLRQVGNMITSGAAATSYSTREMSTLFMAFGIRAFFSFANVYLLTVSMRILGLLYVVNKHKFGWFSR